jgi:hypothetical protein
MGWVAGHGRQKPLEFFSFFLSASGSAFVFTTYAMSRSLPISIDWFFSFPIFERWICMTGFE